MINTHNFKRLLDAPGKTFLLLGPRGTGKSTWLKKNLKPALTIDLLHSDAFFRYKASPSAIRDDVAHLRAGDWVVVDEVQRVPDLLNEIHSLYESAGLHFALTGSSARKLKRADANLLGGRALRCDYFPLVWAEIEEPGLLSACIEFGTLPYVVSSTKAIPSTEGGRASQILFLRPWGLSRCLGVDS